MVTTAASSSVSVTFDCEGSRLFGTLHPAKVPARGTGVILLNQGSVDRAGAHRLYVKMAIQLAALGYPVLRFDARGVGESEGLWDGEENSLGIHDVYGRILRGAWLADANAAIEHFRQTAGADRILLGGLCGGAATALLAGAEHPAVDGMFLIGTPTTFAAVTRRVADLPEAVVKDTASDYVQKLLSIEAWRRFFSFQTEYRTLWEVIKIRGRQSLQSAGLASKVTLDDPRVNGQLLKAIQSAARRSKPMLFVFGENDYLWHEFQEQLPRLGYSRENLPFDLMSIANGNHTLTEQSWQEELFAVVGGWLERTCEPVRNRRQAVHEYLLGGKRS